MAQTVLKGIFLTPLDAFEQIGWNKNRELKGEGVGLNKMMCKALRK